MIYEEFSKERERNHDKRLPYIERLMGVEWRVKRIFADYGKGNVSKSKVLKQLQSALLEWKDAQEAIDMLEEELRKLAKEVEF